MGENVKVTAYSSGKIVSSREVSIHDYYDGNDIPELDSSLFIKGNFIDMVEVILFDFADECFYIHKSFYNSEGRPVRFDTYDIQGNLKKVKMRNIRNEVILITNQPIDKSLEVDSKIA